MASHEVVYGTCENKCRHQVYTTEQTDNKYAPKNHASFRTEYGTADADYYGHVRICDSPSASFGEGVAVVPTTFAMQKTYSKLQEAAARIVEINEELILRQRRFDVLEARVTALEQRVAELENA